MRRPQPKAIRIRNQASVSQVGPASPAGGFVAHWVSFTPQVIEANGTNPTIAQKYGAYIALGEMYVVRYTLIIDGSDTFPIDEGSPDKRLAFAVPNPIMQDGVEIGENTANPAYNFRLVNGWGTLDVYEPGEIVETWGRYIKPMMQSAYNSIDGDYVYLFAHAQDYAENLQNSFFAPFSETVQHARVDVTCLFTLLGGP